MKSIKTSDVTSRFLLACKYYHQFNESLGNLSQKSALFGIVGVQTRPINIFTSMALKNFSWVLPDKLAGSDIPGRGSGSEDSIRKDLLLLSDEGIKCLVSLERPSVPIESFCDQLGLKWYYFPIPDFDVPQNGENFSRLISDIIKTFESGDPVCVHCHAGIGRTGLVLSCVVGRYFGINAGKSIKTVRMTREALDTPEQERFVNVFLDQSHES